MERHEIEAELAERGAQELLDATSDAHLAYTGGDGTPRVVPVGYFWTGEQFVIATADTAPKVGALSARPDVALAIDRGDTPGQARALSIRGRAEITIVDGLVEEYLAAARKSMGVEAAAEFERTAVRCMTGWPASRSRRPGYASTTSARAGCRGSSPNSPTAAAHSLLRTEAVVDGR